MTAIAEHEDVRTERIKGWFAQHEATFGEYIPECARSLPTPETLYWAKPGTGCYSIRYTIQGPVLMVWGDLECAVYRWSSPITWEFLAGCDLQYFEGKCEASPKGRDYEEYDHDLALADFNEGIERRAEEGYDHPDPQEVEEARHAIKYGVDEWRDWMRQEGFRVFGDSWYEWLPGLGKRIAQTCAAHLIGIKMAVAQRAKKGGIS